MISSPPSPPPATPVDGAPRRRLIGSVILMLLCFAPSIIKSLYIVVTGVHIAGLQHASPQRLLRMSIEQIILLALALSVMRRQGRSLIDLGFGSTVAGRWTRLLPRPRDLFPAVCLAVGAGVASYLVECWFLVVMWLWRINVHPQIVNTGFAHVAHSGALTKSLGAVMVLVNPIYEESLVRAYLMTEVVFFTRKPWLALCVSTVVQASYHLYQGVAPAFSYLGLFSVFSFFYMRTGRIWPIILAHMILDGIAVFYH